MKREADLFRRSGFVAGLSPAELEELLSAGAFETWKAGEVIMKEGEDSDSMYLLLDGTVDVTKNMTLMTGGRGFGKAEKSMTRLTAASSPVFGEMSLFGKAPRSATVSAAGDCLLFSLSGAGYGRLCESNPRLGLAVTRKAAAILSARVRKGNEDILKLSTALSIALSR